MSVLSDSLMARRKVLFIVHYFPPMGSVHVMRVLGFVKYLPLFGWRPLVLTMDSAYCWPDRRDHTLVDEVPPGTRVYRTRRLGRPHDQNESARAWARWDRHRHSVGWRAVLQSVTVPQDGGFRWLPYAWRRASEIIGDEDVDLLFTSSPPHNVHLLGLYLSKKHRLPWVADFRDDWMRSALYVAPNRLRRRFDRVCERAVVRQAAGIVCVSPPTTDGFQEVYPEARSKIHTVYNSYDPHDFTPHQPAVKENGVFKIVYAGSMSSSPSGFLRALLSLAAKNRAFADKCKVEFMGPWSPEYAEIAADEQLDSLCSVIGPVAHGKAIESMRAAHVLLLLINYPEDPNKERGMMTAKLCEYVGARKPILALVPDGIAADVVREYSLGPVVAPQNTHAIEEALEQLFRRWQMGTLGPPPTGGLVRMLDRRHTTEQLARIFTDAVSLGR